MYLLVRLTAALPTLIGVSLLSFMLVHLSPGDPLAAISDGQVSQAVLQQMRAFYGLDRPLHEQYFGWLREVTSGNFGVSVATRRAVAPELFEALSNSMKLLVFSIPLMVGLAWGLGIVAAFGRRGRFGSALVGLLGALVSVPSYWLALVLVAVFAVTLNWLPAMGVGPAASWSQVFTTGGVAHAILPVAAAVITPLGILARATKAAVEEAMDRDFVEALRARGASEAHVRWRVARNALPGLFPIYGLQIAYQVGGLVLIETIFAWPGLGAYLVTAIGARDMPAIQGAVLVKASTFVLVNLAADILQTAYDPRARR